MDYKNAGVDIEAGYESVELMKKFVKGTMRPEVLGGLGGFSGAFSLENIKKMEEPILLSGTDGCGTKVKLAFLMDKHDTIGIDAERFLNEMQEQNAKADVIFMDPPRAGSTHSFMASAISLNPDRIVYISCNPETLARDLEFLKKHQYTAEKIQPVDMFPFTTHMETVCLLTRRK